jgi:hypothetical protein
MASNEKMGNDESKIHNDSSDSATLKILEATTKTVTSTTPAAQKMPALPVPTNCSPFLSQKAQRNAWQSLKCSFDHGEYPSMDKLLLHEARCRRNPGRGKVPFIRRFYGQLVHELAKKDASEVVENLGRDLMLRMCSELPRGLFLTFREGVIRVCNEMVLDSSGSTGFNTPDSNDTGTPVDDLTQRLADLNTVSGGVRISQPMTVAEIAAGRAVSVAPTSAPEYRHDRLWGMDEWLEYKDYHEQELRAAIKSNFLPDIHEARQEIKIASFYIWAIKNNVFQGEPQYEAMLKTKDYKTIAGRIRARDAEENLAGHYGGFTKLENWQMLLMDLGVEDIPTTSTQCKKVIPPYPVNIKVNNTDVSSASRKDPREYL